jgi:hypothetical protein
MGVDEDPSAAGGAAGGDYRRDETRADQLDRNWNELLQEIRVLQTGSQILAAFLIVLPFQDRFEDLDRFQVGWYLGVLLLALIIVALLLTPVGMHRRLFRKRVKDEMVTVANTLLRTALLLLAVLLSGVAVFVVDIVLSRPIALGAGLALLLLMIALLVLLPARIVRRGPAGGAAAGSRHPEPTPPTGARGQTGRDEVA